MCVILNMPKDIIKNGKEYYGLEVAFSMVFVYTLFVHVAKAREVFTFIFN